MREFGGQFRVLQQHTGHRNFLIRAGFLFGFFPSGNSITTLAFTLCASGTLYLMFKFGSLRLRRCVDARLRHVPTGLHRQIFTTGGTMQFCNSAMGKNAFSRRRTTTVLRNSRYGMMHADTDFHNIGGGYPSYHIATGLNTTPQVPSFVPERTSFTNPMPSGLPQGDSPLDLLGHRISVDGCLFAPTAQPVQSMNWASVPRNVALAQPFVGHAVGPTTAALDVYPGALLDEGPVGNIPF